MTVKQIPLSFSILLFDVIVVSGFSTLIKLYLVLPATNAAACERSGST